MFTVTELFLNSTIILSKRGLMSMGIQIGLHVSYDDKNHTNSFSGPWTRILELWVHQQLQGHQVASGIPKELLGTIVCVKLCSREDGGSL